MNYFGDCDSEGKELIWEGKTLMERISKAVVGIQSAEKRIPKRERVRATSGERRPRRTQVRQQTS